MPWRVCEKPAVFHVSAEPSNGLKDERWLLEMEGSQVLQSPLVSIKGLCCGVTMHNDSLFQDRDTGLTYSWEEWRKLYTVLFVPLLTRHEQQQVLPFEKWATRLELVSCDYVDAHWNEVDTNAGCERIVP